jgi:hypothetical protein
MAVRLEVILPSNNASQDQIDDIIWFIYNKLNDERDANPEVRKWMVGKPIVQQPDSD